VRREGTTLIVLPENLLHSYGVALLLAELPPFYSLSLKTQEAQDGESILIVFLALGGSAVAGSVKVINQGNEAWLNGWVATTKAGTWS